MRLLIADSDKAFLEVVQTYLGRRGHDAEVAASGLECIARLRDFVPDFVVLEQRLPWGGADGVMAQMWEAPNLSNVPVILIADEEPLVAIGSLATPPLVGWLQKPFRLGDLVRHIESDAQHSKSKRLKIGAT